MNSPSAGVAFLVGVWDYKNLDKLDFVENDLNEMKDYLLDMGGFDSVYVLKNKVVIAELILEYMQNKFRDKADNFPHG